MKKEEIEKLKELLEEYLCLIEDRYPINNSLAAHIEEVIDSLETGLN